MFIALEGVDGSGKSTVAEKLRAALEERGYSVDMLHRGVPERNVLDEYQLDVEDYRPGANRAIVADRWHWGDIVYGELYRGRSYLQTAGFRFVELFLRSRGAITVLVENTEDVIKNRLLERGEDYLKLDDIGHVITRYREVMAESTTGFHTTDDPDVAEILRYAEFWSTSAQDLAPFPTYIGSRTPRVLLVGEKRSNPDSPSMSAFRPSPTMGGSGAFLLETLPDEVWRSAGICNALEEPDLPGLIETLAGPPVIALGREASKALDAHGIDHGAVPHPAYIKRFHNGEQLNYGQLITRIIRTGDKEYSWPR
jgi:ribose 1,5-bisphosphokinase PhnN